MNKTIPLILVTILTISATCSCKSNTSTEAENNIKSDSLYAAPSNEPTLNVYFLLDDTKNLLEYFNGKCFGGKIVNGFASQEVRLSEKVNAIMKIRTKDGQASIIIEGKESILADENIVSIKAMELDGDGELEIIAHNGEYAEATIFKLKEKKIVKCGTTECNNTFWKTKYNTIVSRMGDTGHAFVSKIENYTLKEIYNFYIPQTLFASEGFTDLEYIFAPKTNKKLKPIFSAKKYATGIEENVILSYDFDKDGTEEQVIFFKAERGLTLNDELIFTSDKKAIEFLIPIIIENSNDSTSIERDDYNCQIKQQIQLSASDIDNDGSEELIITIGTSDKNESFVFKYHKRNIEFSKRI